MRACLLALLLSACAPVHWDDPVDAVDYCMTLGEVPYRDAAGVVRCTGD